MKKHPTKFIYLLLRVLLLNKRVNEMSSLLRLPLDKEESHVHPIIHPRECISQVIAPRHTLKMGEEIEVDISRKEEGFPFLLQSPYTLMILRSQIHPWGLLKRCTPCVNTKGPFVFGEG